MSHREPQQFMLRVYPFGIRTGTGSEGAAANMNYASAPAFNGLRMPAVRFRHIQRAAKRRGSHEGGQETALVR